MQSSARILIVDDERVALRNLEHVMKKEGYEVTSTQSGANALNLLEEQRFDVVLTDLRMEKVDGMQILKKCRELYPDTEVIMITGYATLDSAVEAMKHGAFYYIAKPFKLDEVRKVVSEAVEKVRLKRENRHLREQIETYQGKVKIITQDPGMQRLLDTAQQIAPTDCNVLLERRKRHGQGALRAFPPPEQPASRRAFLRHQLRRIQRRTARQRALRPRKRRLHRGIDHEERPDRNGFAGNAASR